MLGKPVGQARRAPFMLRSGHEKNASISWPVLPLPASIAFTRATSARVSTFLEGCLGMTADGSIVLNDVD